MITYEIETIPTMERQELEEKVQGITRAGKVLVPSMVGKLICVGMTDGRLIDGVCEGFKTVNGDLDIRDPFLTIETHKDEVTHTKLQLPPNRIASLDAIE